MEGDPDSLKLMTKEDAYGRSLQVGCLGRAHNKGLDKDHRFHSSKKLMMKARRSLQ